MNKGLTWPFVQLAFSFFVIVWDSQPSFLNPDPSQVFDFLKLCSFLKWKAYGISLALESSSSALPHSKHCVACHAGDMSAVSHSRHVFCVTQQTCPAVSHSRHVCCDTPQRCLGFTQQTCLLCQRAEMSAVSHSRILPPK